jgi:archaeal flagellar protein FlaF
MAVAGIIAAAIGIALLIIVAYVIVGGTLSAGETITNAQKDVSQLTEIRMGTSIALNKSETQVAGQGLNFSVANTGNEMIGDFTHMDIFLQTGAESDGYQYLTYNGNTCGIEGTWCIYGEIVPDTIHPRQLDPGEKMWVWATFSGGSPVWFQVTTGNGINAQTTYP